MRSLLSAVTIGSLLAACGQANDGLATSSDTDDLSATTYSMEMVRANPSLAPDVVVPPGMHVNGLPRPADDSLNPNDLVWHMTYPGDFLYTASQLGQFSNLADPAIFPSDKNSATYSRQPGDLYAAENKLVWSNIEQGALGDCYFMASFVAAVFADNGGPLSKSLIVPHKTGSKVTGYDVTFYQANGRKVRIEVDPDLLHDNTGAVFYAASTQTMTGYEEWAPSLVEKAYASWHKSYGAIGNGGTAADAIFAFTGEKTVETKAKDPNIVSVIDTAGKNGKAQVACTYGEGDHVSYKDTGIYADHCYTLRGIHNSGGTTYVQLRNPWGPTDSTRWPSEPPGDGVDDGIFEIPLATFQTLYDDVSILP